MLMTLAVEKQRHEGLPSIAWLPECYNENYVKSSLRQSTSQGTKASHVIA